MLEISQLSIPFFIRLTLIPYGRPQHISGILNLQVLLGESVNYSLRFFPTTVFIRKSLNNRVKYRDEDETHLLSTDHPATAKTAV